MNPTALNAMALQLALRLAHGAMALCLGVMALAVFVNVILRYGFGTGIAASEELSRLLFVWMVFIGATAAYPLGEHMAFTSLLAKLRSKPAALMAATVIIRILVIGASGLIAWGAWSQVNVGWATKSPVMGYPAALLPLPALISGMCIAAFAVWELVQMRPLINAESGDFE